MTLCCCVEDLQSNFVYNLPCLSALHVWVTVLRRTALKALYAARCMWSGPSCLAGCHVILSCLTLSKLTNLSFLYWTNCLYSIIIFQHAVCVRFNYVNHTSAYDYLNMNIILMPNKAEACDFNFLVNILLGVRRLPKRVSDWMKWLASILVLLDEGHQPLMAGLCSLWPSCLSQGNL